MLAKQVKLKIDSCHEKSGEEADPDGGIKQLLAPVYGSRYINDPIPKYELPSSSLPPLVAYQLVHDELNLDGNPALNLATFVTTWMEPEADRLMQEALSKNYIDADEYPQTVELQNRCVNILANLFHASDSADFNSVGCATVGSSEAIHLAGLALKWNWRKRRNGEGLPTDKPNIVMGHNVQVCWEKFARYFEVEPRYVPLSENRYVLGVEEALSMVDENTICVVGILGSTYTGEYEPIEQLNQALLEMNNKTGWDVPIHVDGASGGFVAPFVSPEIRWDFRLPLVRSINVSGHKYGLVYPGIGWVIWKDESDLPEELVFHVNYLGGDEPTFGLNFSRGAGCVIAQYYNFLRLGFQGYREIMLGCQSVAKFLTDSIEQMGRFEFLSKQTDLPVVCLKLKNTHSYSVFDISEELRKRGWIVPAYTLAPNAENIAVLRIVVREGFSEDMAGLLVSDIKKVVTYLESASHPISKVAEAGFATPETTKFAAGKTKTRGVC